MKQKLIYYLIIIAISISACNKQIKLPEDARIDYTKKILSDKQLLEKTTLIIDTTQKSEESFIIKQNGDKYIIETGGPGGLIYAANELINGTKQSELQSPDFPIRGTVLFLMKEGSYDYLLTPEEFPWFFDKEILTEYFDYLAINKFNTLFLWSGHLFPSIMELPEYPDASPLNKDELKRNQEQFKWFTDECAKRNIKVLLHFYNIHITKNLAESRKIPMHYTKPDSFVTAYYTYTLTQFFNQFQSVGAYVCPGEALRAEHQPEWIRDVIFKAAKQSGKHPLIVIRDWGMDKEKFAKICLGQYDNFYTELKHNVEMLVSPAPDERHNEWKETVNTHIVNLHEVGDLKPFRWGSPLFIEETVKNWKAMKLDGAEIYGLISWRWPNTLDKFDSTQTEFWAKGKHLITFKRDAIWLEAFGRYLWKADRNPADEEQYWTKHLESKFGNTETAKLLYKWYITTGVILPGLQNLSAIANMNWFPTAVAREQLVDYIIYSQIEDGAFTNVSRYRGLYPTRPFDQYTIDRYKEKYNISKLTDKIRMPVKEYALHTLSCNTEINKITPDKICELYIELAKQSIEIAQELTNKATVNKDEAERFVSDSRALLYITQHWNEKIEAAIYKTKWIAAKDEKYLDTCITHLENSVNYYKQLKDLTDSTYINSNDMKMWLSWENGYKHFIDDLEYHKTIKSKKIKFDAELWEKMPANERIETLWKQNYFEKYPGLK